MAGYVLHCTFLCGSNHLETKLQAVEQGDMQYHRKYLKMRPQLIL